MALADITKCAAHVRFRRDGDAVLFLEQFSRFRVAQTSIILGGVVNADLYRLMALYSFAKAEEEANRTLRTNFESAALAYLRMAEQARHGQSVGTPGPAPKQNKSGPPD